MKILVVSLEADTARRHQMSGQLGPSGLDWSFYDAVQVGEPPPDYDRAGRKKWYGFEMTRGEIGCFLSHRALWRRCAASRDAAWCILEDDVRLLPGFAAALKALEADAAHWDLVRLVPHLPRRGWVQRRLPGGRALLMYHRQPAGTHGYVITPHAARVLADYTRRIVEPIDNAIDTYWQHGLDVFGLEPPVLALDEQVDSAIGARGAARRPRLPGLRRDLRKGLSLAQRLAFNRRRYGRWR